MNESHNRSVAVDVRRTSSQTLASVVRHPLSGCFFGLGLLSALCVSVNGHAQSAAVLAETTPLSRLTVRPHAMTLGAATTTAGEQKLDSLPGYVLYVPKNCVGTRRVPIIVSLHGGAGNGQQVVDAMREKADKYGMIVLAPTAAGVGWDVVYDDRNPEHESAPRPLVSRTVISQFQDVQSIDRALAYVLKNFAIDPDKIALMGGSDGGSYALYLGRNNEDVFSRVIVGAPYEQFDGSLGQRNKQTRFLISSGTQDRPGRYILSVAREIRAEGHEVELIFSTKGHVPSVFEDHYMWNWLAQGWKWETPIPIEALPSRSFSDNDPLLTAAALKKLLTFWKAFEAEPDSIRAVALKSYLAYGTLMVGQEPVIINQRNLAPLVAAYPSVAAKLKKAGLTVQQEDRYRIALLRMHFLIISKSPIKSKSPSNNPTIVKNHAFYMSHLDQLKELWFKTSIWTPEWR